MKKKCPVCEARKGRRDCLLRNMETICSLCCAEIRTHDRCQTCQHFIASMKFDAKRSAPGSQMIEFLIEINPEVEQAVDNALRFAEGGNLARALELLQELEREHPRNHLICYGLGTVKALGGKHDEAILHLDKAIEIYPYFIEAMFNRATSYRDMLDIPNAIRKYREVLEIADPADFVAKHSREVLKSIAETIQKHHGTDLDAFLNSNDEFVRVCDAMDQGEWSTALAGLQNCATQVPRNPPTLGNMGICLAALGRKADALAALDRALEINPDYQPASSNRPIIERMEEGTPAEISDFRSINFAKEQLERK